MWTNLTSVQSAAMISSKIKRLLAQSVTTCSMMLAFGSGSIPSFKRLWPSYSVWLVKASKASYPIRPKTALSVPSATKACSKHLRKSGRLSLESFSKLPMKLRRAIWAFQDKSWRKDRLRIGIDVKDSSKSQNGRLRTELRPRSYNSNISSSKKFSFKNVRLR